MRIRLTQRWTAYTAGRVLKVYPNVGRTLIARGLAEEVKPEAVTPEAETAEALPVAETATAEPLKRPRKRRQKAN